MMPMEGRPSDDRPSVRERPPDVPGPPAPPSPPEQESRPWSAGRVIALVVGSLLGLGSLGILGTGIAGLVLDQTQRDSDGYLVTDPVELSSDGYAITGAGLAIDTDAPDLLQARSVTGDLQVRVESTTGDDVFVGIARESDAAAYLADIDYAEVTSIHDGDVTYELHSGGEPATAPAEQDFWAESVSGPGEQTLTFELEEGRWVVVAMNADAGAGIDVDVRAAAEVPVLTWVAFGLIVFGAAGLLVAILLIYLPVR